MNYLTGAVPKKKTLEPPEEEEENQEPETEQENDDDEEVILEAFDFPQQTIDEEEEADRDQELLQQACLPVSGAPLPPGDEPPKDADEYLRQVQWERLHVPDVVSVEVEEKPQRRRKRQGCFSKAGSLLEQFDTTEVPEELSYCSQWAEDVAEAFEQLRLQCTERRRRANGFEGPHHQTFEAWRARCDRERPSMALLAAQDFLSVNHLVVVLVDAVVAAHEALASGGVGSEEGAAPAAEASPVETERLGQLAEWMFAALAFVDYPLVDDLQYQLQRLRRTCKKLLIKLHPGSTHSSGSCGHGVEIRGPFQAKANLLLVIVTRVFGQW